MFEVAPVAGVGPSVGHGSEFSLGPIDSRTSPKWEIKVGTNDPKHDERKFERDLTSLRVAHFVMWFGSAFLCGAAGYNLYDGWSPATSIGGVRTIQEATILLRPTILATGFLISGVVFIVGANILKAQLLMLRDRAKPRGAGVE